MIPPTALTSGMAAAARRYDAAAGNIAIPAVRPAVTSVAADPAEARLLAPAAYSANAAMSRTADDTRGSLVDLLA